MPEPIATWNPARSVWETTQTMLCGHSELFSETWPAWGMTQGGVAFALPTRVPRMDGSASSSLPTPRATDGTKGGPNQRGSSGDLMLPSAVAMLPTPVSDNSRGLPSPGTDFQSLPNVAASLLPTPTMQAAKHGSTPDTTANAHGYNLWDIPHLLPTPAVNDMGAGKTPEQWDEWTARLKLLGINGNGHGPSLAIEAARLLPTPTVQDAENVAGQSQEARNSLPLNAAVRLTSAPTPPPSTDGSAS